MSTYSCLPERSGRPWRLNAASILHWHVRDPATGDPRNDVELHLEVLEGLHARTDALLHPTLGYISQSGIEERVKHVRAGDEDAKTRIDLVPVDFGTFNIDLWDAENRRWQTLDNTYHNPRSYLKIILETFKKMNKKVLTICVAQLAQTLGRRVAKPADVRRMLQWRDG